MAKKKAMKYFDDPIYGFRFFILSKREFKKYFPDEFEATSWNCLGKAIYHQHENNDLDVNTVTAFYFSEKFFEADEFRQHAIIAHECWHILEVSLFNVGVAIQLGEINEHLAYYMSFLVENVSRIIYSEKQD